ncbi:Gfo/Idh/MocA family oxidoreductase [Agathobaculum sp. NTUH-O15-33]|uniref:Gfo/Idh/MocA family protein n=1 Tax=Agathobaculum sp. NTUH-O15-33 TaxID=3079302 RepID=UPI002958D0D8|nr:Gfo/Idh/MocA family oxidoreductase [Agathobaculum sp. NTUH-O15-33]WNX84435.1 Gfo/Idh/MocA family oxidoreductase [Agathobaculum sp. NTUH-O15-33]
MIYGEKKVNEPIRWAMVGGGKGSQIGYIHRSSALRDFNFQLVAGAFDIDAERGRAFGEKLHVAPERCYPDYKTLFAEEAKRPDGIQAVSIATPNFTHFEIARAALNAGLHVYCEKPLCFTTEEARELEELVKKTGKIMFVSYGYSGHQMIEQARRMIERGDLGKIRIVNMQFAHGAHNVAVEKNSASTAWRVDPKKAGPAYVLGDVGTHLIYLSEAMMPEMKIRRLMCSKQAFVESRKPLEDNAMTIMEYDNGAVGYIWSSCVNAGSEFGARFRIVGEKASIAWDVEHPNQLAYEVQGQPQSVMQRGAGYLYPEATADDRIGGGHPEGLFESWSNLYARFAQAIDKCDKGEEIDFWYPDIHAGVLGVKWVEKCVESADHDSAWVEY